MTDNENVAELMLKKKKKTQKNTQDKFQKNLIEPQMWSLPSQIY